MMDVELAFFLGISCLLAFLVLLDFLYKLVFQRKQLLAWWNGTYISDPSLPDHLECRVDYQGYLTSVRMVPSKLSKKIRDKHNKFADLEKLINKR